MDCNEGFEILRSFYELGFRNTLAKSWFDRLKKGNVEPGETMDLESGNWSKLNNAVMVFDKKHPLLYKFIEDFALTFDGNKWGHNGPYLVSRVVARVSGRPGFNFTVLAPSAFNLVDWRRVPGFFHGPQNESHSQWLLSKLQQVHERSFGQTKKLKIEEGSVISHILKDSCVFCNSSATTKL
ncbi:Alpha 1,4-glycosyltransferase domain [Dillenia turbinata]|uniref:Alpha 1,4-glycosyltransferase domain n=1 Tax=Dillenia turbinata TaxID=194707 RepID=A0AAN8VRY6_9MAGN